MRTLRLTLTATAATAAVLLAACTTHPAARGSGTVGRIGPTVASSAPAPSGTSPTPPAGTSPTPATHTGTAFFTTSQNTAIRVNALRDGHVTKLATLPADATVCTANTVTVAPDGKHVAWVHGTVDTSDHGTFMLADIDGGHQHTLAENVSCHGPTALRWVEPPFVEGYDAGTGRKLDFDIADGTPTQGDPGLERDPVWSVTGSAIAARDETGALTVSLTTGGSGPVPVHYTPKSPDAGYYDGWSVRSVSLDGRYLAVGWNGTDPSRRDDSFAIVKVATGTEVKLPEPSIEHAEFLADGTLLIQHGSRLDILDKTFHKISSITLPASLADLMILRFVG